MKTNWREELRRTLLAWINKSDVNYRLADEHHGAGYTVDVNDLLAQISPFIKEAEQNARREVIEEVEEAMPLHDAVQELLTNLRNRFTL